MADYDPRFQAPSEANLLSKGWGTTQNDTWGADLCSYEYSKRHEVHPGKMVSPELRVMRGHVSREERKFNPITQRFQDPQLEKQLKRTEKELTVEHSNRARDIQTLREQHHDVVHNGSKLMGLEAVTSPQQRGHIQDPRGKAILPDSCQGRVDYNIISNIGYHEHNWAPADERPLPPLRIPRAREVPANLYREFNIISNRYLEDHDMKTARDEELVRAEKTAKHHIQNRFHPLAQKFVVQEEETRMQVADECHSQEERIIQHANEPPTMKHRATAFYNPVNHAVTDENMLKWMDLVEDERKMRYRKKHFVNLDMQNRGLAGEHQEEQRRLNRQHWDKHRTEIERGHNIITNHHFEGRGAVPPFRPYAEATGTPWSNAMYRNGKDRSTDHVSKRGDEVLKRMALSGSQTDRTNYRVSPRMPVSERLNLATPRMPSGASVDRTQKPMALGTTAPPAPSLPASSQGNAVYSQGI